MFKSFREKLSNAVKSFGKKAEEEAVEQAPEETEKEEIQEDSDDEETQEDEDIKSEEEEGDTEADKEPAAEKKGIFSRISGAFTTTKLTQAKFEELFWDIEVVLLENNVAMEVVEKIKQDMASKLVEQPLQRSKLLQIIKSTLKDTISSLFEQEPIDLVALAKEKSPLVVCFVGINGSGKTTTIAKTAHMLKAAGVKSVLAASDTFRAAAIDQLQMHAKNLDLKIIKHEYGSDAAAVAFDALEHAKSAKLGAVLIDTAGRMHSNANLMDEMKKIIRVAKPDLKIFVGESITGNDCIEQVKKFDEAIGIDGIILSKADVDEKGGTAISVSYVTGKPILYMGVGQEYSDLKPFDPKIVIEGLGLD